MLLRAIPHAITLSNLLCGCLAIYFAFGGAYVTCAALVLSAAFLDFFDGLAARALGVSGELGKQLDSLCDVVSFGVAPALLVVLMLQEGAGGLWFTFLPLTMALLSALRLAIFNIDTRQSDRFIGVPTPANALFWVSWPLVFWQGSLETGTLLNTPKFLFQFWEYPLIVAFLSVVFALLLVAPLPLLALKFKNYNWVSNKFRFVLIALSAAMLILWGFAAIPLIVLLYLALSLIATKQP